MINLLYKLLGSGRPSLLGLSILRFTNSTWLEDLQHQKRFNEYLFQGKLDCRDYRLAR